MKTFANEIMSRKVTTATPKSTVEEMLKVFVNKKITGLPVVNAKGKMIGVYSEYDLIQQVASAGEINPEVLRQVIVYTEKVEAVRHDEVLERIVSRFVGQKFRRLPVVDDQGHLVGIITRRDLMKVFFYQAKLPLDEESKLEIT